jgi:hypothetical protein
MRSVLMAVVAAIAALALWRHLVPGGAMFYQGIAVAVVFAGLHRMVTARNSSIRSAEANKSALLVLLLVYAFVFTVPTTVDRSYSVLMLRRIDGAPTGLSRDQLVAHFANEFASDGAIDRRLREQAVTGTVVHTEGHWRTTALGRGLTKAFDATCFLFRCETN